MAPAKNMPGGECEGRPAASPLHKGLHHANDPTSRTSLTLTDSWDASARINADGVDVPPFLSAFLGVDFLPFSQIIQEEVIPVPPMDVPRSVEITAEDPLPGSQDDVVDEDGDAASVNSCHHALPVLPPAPAVQQETDELQEMLLESSKKKKKAGKRFKAAARAVMQRVKKGGSVGSRRKTSKRVPQKGSEVVVETATGTTTFDRQLWISPTATTATDGTLSPITCIDEVADNMLRKQTQNLREKAEEQEKNMKTTHSEIEGLQSKLSGTICKYQTQLAEFQATQEELAQLAANTDLEKPDQATPTKEERRRVFKRSESGTFMRVHDLDLSGSSRSSDGSESASVSSLSQSAHNTQKGNQQLQIPTPEFLLMDHYLLEIVHQLLGLGFDLAIDETDRFTPARDTARLVSQMPASAKTLENGWPVKPWTPAWDKHVLVWMGSVSHDGFGHTWPVVKGRTILQTSAEHVLEYLWDSSLVPKYNPLCQGRQDLYTLQDDVHMTEKESPYGFAGCAKIVRSLNKHRLLPKAIEMKVLMYARPLQQHKGSYILVSRSVWENDNATLESKVAKTVIRTEMLLGSVLLRAIDDNTCEMTNLTHVHSPGVPEFMARKASPGQCHGLMKTLQGLFPVPK